MLKVDKKGNILRPVGTVLGAPNKKGGVYRAGNRTGRIDIATGDVYDLKEVVIGQVDVTKFEVLADAIAKLAKPAKPTKAKQTKTTAKKEEPKKVEVKKETKKEEKKDPEKEYRPGLDSALLVSGQFRKLYYGEVNHVTSEQSALNELNTKLKTNYPNWDELSRKIPDLTDAQLSKYEIYVNWYEFLKYHPNREFDATHKKKFRTHLMVRTLGLVPFNGSVDKVDNRDYHGEMSARKYMEKKKEEKAAKMAAE